MANVTSAFMKVRLGIKVELFQWEHQVPKESQSAHAKVRPGQT